MKVFKPWKKDYPTGALWEFVTELCGPSNKNLIKKFLEEFNRLNGPVWHFHKFVLVCYILKSSEMMN